MQAVRASTALPILAPMLLLCSSLFPNYCAAQQERPTEAQVKAAYVYNFGKFVRWQNTAPATESFDICVLGKNPFGSALQNTVSGEQIEAKSIVVKNATIMQNDANCRILFISSSEESRLKSILPLAQQSNSLTVSDIPGFAQRGGMIELVSQEGRVRFEVNLAAAGNAGLTVSSELLKVAVKVIGTNQTGETGR